MKPPSIILFLLAFTASMPVAAIDVFHWVDENGVPTSLDKDGKRAIIGTLLGRFAHSQEHRTLFDLASRTASSPVGAYEGETQRLELPDT